MVVDDRSFEVTAYHQKPRSMLLSVVSDGGNQCSFEVAGWRPWSCGAGWGAFYLWSARQLIVFPKSLPGDPSQVEFDEDLLLAFELDIGWVFVCETSVRLAADHGEMARVEFDEVIERARWEHGHLIVRDISGSEKSISVSVGDLVVGPADFG